MIIKINFSSSKPIYQQLKDQIVEGIAKKELKNGEKLPSIRQLAGDIGINMHTVNKVYNQLRIEGYIRIHKHRSMIVNTKNMECDEQYLSELSEKMKPIIAESICHGLSSKDFHKHTSAIFNKLNLGRKL